MLPLPENKLHFLMWRLDSGQIRFTTRVKHSFLFALIWNVYASPFLHYFLWTTWCRHKYTKGLLQPYKPFKCKPAGRQPKIELSGKQIYSLEITFFIIPFAPTGFIQAQCRNLFGYTYEIIMKKKNRRNKCQKLVSLQKLVYDLTLKCTWLL